MNTIWKYTLSPDIQTFGVPAGAKPLSVAVQNGDICLWMEVDSTATQEERTFEVFGTGHKIPSDMGVDRRFIGTVLLSNGALVFHVYERL